MLDYILKLVVEGQIEVHNKVKSTDIKRGNFVAGGAAAKVYRAKMKGKDKEVALKVFNPNFIAFDPNEFKKGLAILRYII
jgi:hypothetical protein